MLNGIRQHNVLFIFALFLLTIVSREYELLCIKFSMKYV